MRYYRLEITDSSGNPPVDSSGNQIGPFDTSETPGRGLHIEFDATITGYDVTSSGTMVAVYGLPISMLNQNVKLNGYQLNLFAGFTAGLPLENPAQALRDPHKSALINQHHILVGSGEVIKNGAQHRSF